MDRQMDRWVEGQIDLWIDGWMGGGGINSHCKTSPPCVSLAAGCSHTISSLLGRAKLCSPGLFDHLKSLQLIPACFQDNIVSGRERQKTDPRENKQQLWLAR
ncbi:hypothetical protein ATANTOWER_010390 [Ataeniobius toweri]|uniref:Uncharacterized protein n=1 Tax=Ataeniobius toweri TaxID=208326 RepID=A0ABU7AG73_9TELE|nr:hypothetical protein [Ataeniobius toweri]